MFSQQILEIIAIIELVIIFYLFFRYMQTSLEIVGLNNMIKKLTDNIKLLKSNIEIYQFNIQVLTNRLSVAKLNFDETTKKLIVLAINKEANYHEAREAALKACKKIAKLHKF